MHLKDQHGVTEGEGEGDDLKLEEQNWDRSTLRMTGVDKLDRNPPGVFRWKLEKKLSSRTRCKSGMHDLYVAAA